MDLVTVNWLLSKERERVGAKDTSDWVGTVDDLVATLHPKQREFVLDPGRRIAALVGRGGGKTTGGLARLARRCFLTEGAKCAFIATTRQHAKELIWEKLKELCDRASIPARFFESELKVVFEKNGSLIRLYGADDMKSIEKMRGLPHHEVGIDEGASHKPLLLKHLINRIIAPRLGDYNGCLWMIGTPGLQAGPFYEVTRNGSELSRLWADRELPEYEGWNRWSLHKWTLQDGAPYVPAMARLWAEALVTLEADYNGDWNHPTFRREYLGEHAADDTDTIFRYHPHDEEGAEFNQWDPPRVKKWESSTSTFAKMPEGEWSYVYGFDFGWADAFALGVYAFREGDKCLYHVGEVVRKEMYPRKIAELLLGKELDSEKPGGVIGLTGWPVGTAADKSAGGNLIMEELSAVYGVAIEAADKKQKHDSIELTNGDLMDGRIKILKGSKLEEQLLANQWDVDQYGKLRERRDQPNDMTDTLIYARRRAKHLLQDDSEPEEPIDPHSAEALTAAMQASEDARATSGQRGFFDSYDDGYDDWDLYGGY